MKNVNSIQCEGCGQIFPSADLTAQGTIGRHEWTPSDRVDWWDDQGFISDSEQECREHMAAWTAEQQAYANQKVQINQRHAENGNRVVERCRQDDLLRQIVAAGDTKTAIVRIDRLCEELGLEADDLTPLGFEWSYWAVDFYQRCLDAAQADSPT